nr:SWIM zinc finger family protein [uncultured Catonella sp.]
MGNTNDNVFEKNQNDWLEWGVDIHNDPEQVKRINNSKSKNTTPTSISECSGVFHGSKKDYLTTLLSCSCRDFAIRKKPCKHMYRLAYELGIYMLDGVLSDTSISEKKRIDDVMPIVFSLSDDLQILYRDICYSCGNDNKTSKGYMLDVDIANTFIDKHLLCPVVDKAKLITHCYVKNVRNVLKTLTDDDLPRKGSELFDYALTNFPNIILPLPSDKACLELPNDISHLAMSIRKRLYNKFPVEQYYFLF